MNQQLKEPCAVDVHLFLNERGKERKGGTGRTQRFIQPNLLATDWLYGKETKSQPLVVLMRLYLVNRVPGNELGVQR